MLIFNQDRDKLINLNKVQYIDVDIRGDGYKNEIYTNYEDNSSISLGWYITKEEANEVLQRIADAEGAVNVFYMPKE